MRKKLLGFRSCISYRSCTMTVELAHSCVATIKKKCRYILLSKKGHPWTLRRTPTSMSQTLAVYEQNLADKYGRPPRIGTPIAQIQRN